jgi:uncharacterized membrane protein
VFFSYVLSFIYLGIYWNNHHHLLHTDKHVTGGVLWANLHLLFWLSLFPFVTGFMGENHFAPLPAALYGGVLMMAGVAYWILTGVIIHADGAGSVLATAVGKDTKGKLSVVLYAVLILCALYVNHWVAQGIYGCVALMWLVPDRRIERVVNRED